MAKQTLKAETRKLVGRKVKTLRGKGILPANVYGKKVKSESLQVNFDEFKRAYKDVGETGLLYLQVSGEKGKMEEKPVLVANVQKDHVTDAVLHVDFHQVDLKEKVEAKVPIELSGESPAEKQGVGTVVQYISEVEVEALPTDLPEKFTLDISKLAEVDQAIYIKDLPVDRAKVELKTDPESILAKVEPPQKEEVVVPPVPPEGEIPAEGAVPVEGETPAEGQTPTQEKAEALKEEKK